MRPQILYALFRPVETLTGVGPKIGRLLAGLAGSRVLDLIWHLPGGLVDRRHRPLIGEAEPGAIATLTVQIVAHVPGRGPRRPYRVQCRDESGGVDLVFFHPNVDWLQSTLPIGQTRVVSGRLDVFRDQPQMVHPDWIVEPEAIDKVAVVEPVYPLTAGLQAKSLSRALASALKAVPDLPEWQDPAWLQRQGWPGWRTSVIAAHHPEAEADLSPTSKARARLAYDEALANQLSLFLVRASHRREPGRAQTAVGTLAARARDALPFTLTPAQETVLAEILGDLAVPERMLRLLQGDVGSGKTVVALLAMLTVVEGGAQAALMAPTEVLTRQHYETIAPICARLGVTVGLLTGRDKGKARSETLARLAGGQIQIVIGTHALIQDGVVFRDLGLAIVDEQHRFGVEQRLRLADRGRDADVLVMTATPIPRTLQLTAYGDMDVSKLTGKPPGRRPVDTRALPADRLRDVVDAVSRKIGGTAGAEPAEMPEKVFWVCPLVADTETSDLAAATARAEALEQVFPGRVALVHGRMSGADKDAALARFADGDAAILVATTVIEVGVDVPAATVIVVEHAERFGLAQLHQLRGRVGRSDRPGTCLLVYAPPLGPTARARLSMLRGTDDGFRIAEEDLRLRGAGEVLGTRQSGLPDFRLLDIAVHGDLLAAARDDARLILQKDPQLRHDRGEALRILLSLFEREAAMQYLKSG